ncbi:MAG: peptidase MA family metallohydrolase, partial [bacterium]
MRQNKFWNLPINTNEKYGGWKKVAQFLPLLLLVIGFSDAFGQFSDYFGFGKNKVQYKSFDWSVISTEHFNIHYYKEERQAAMDAAEMAERSYAYLSEVLDYKFKNKIPLLLYASHNDFQQTNAIQSFISEGTQGVTESLKGRMILPITGSYTQFVHVLTHEMVHAFQFDMLLAEGPADLVRRFNPPLWFIEGMAEYLSVGMDNITRMWMRDAVLNNTLLTIPEMNVVFDIRVYRMGQAIWYYVGERYGKEVVGRIFKTARATGDITRAFKAHTGLDLNELSKRWQDDARTRYLPENVVLKKPGEVAKPLTDPCVDCTSINIVPAISPDGQEIAYIGDKNYTLNMFLRDLDDRGNLHRIVKSGSSQSYEVLRYFDTSMNWSPDGKQFSFVAKAGGNDAIYIVDAKKRKVIRKLSFKKLTGMAAPSWSPDGERMVFSGIRGGISDLYLVNKDGSNLKRLTDDRYSYLHPQWSPDGTKIAFTTERGPNTNIDKL